MKKTSHKNNSPILFKLALLVLIILLGIWFLYPSNKTMNLAKQDNQVMAQLSPSSGTGMGTAVKKFEKSTYTLNVSGVLSKPAKGEEYFVWLQDGDSKSPSVMLLGKMTTAGDVYSFNYTGDKNLSYKTVVISQQTEAEAKSGKLNGEILSGSFEK